jgi:hypothetical protein
MINNQFMVESTLSLSPLQIVTSKGWMTRVSTLSKQ